MDSTIQPIETKYKGYTFRSRLEARWAVFYDTLDVEWHYEHEGYETSYGRYVPDFWLPQVGLRRYDIKGVWHEVKPEGWDRDKQEWGHVPDYEEWGYADEHPALFEVAKKNNAGAILTLGFPDPKNTWGLFTYEIAPYGDHPMTLWRCPLCGRTRVEFPEGSYDECYHGCDFHKEWGVLRGKSGFVPFDKQIADAIQTALRYRFW